ncbi:MAG: hypothetical protein WC546_06590 [Candidatus Omnitrophota bacterium]
MKKSCGLCLLFLLVLTFIPSVFSQETLTIATYYPSPIGVYDEVRTRRAAIGDNYYDASQYCWGAGCTNQVAANADLVVEGRTGIGTFNPAVPLDVMGGSIHVHNDNNTLRGSLYTAPSDETGLYDEEFVLSLTSADGAQSGDSRSSIFIGPSASGAAPATGRVEVSADKIYLNPNGGNTGIGIAHQTNINAKLDVQGEVKIGNTNLACNANTRGALRHYNNAIQYCSPTGWRAVGGSCKMLRGRNFTKNNSCIVTTFPIAFPVGTIPSVMATPQTRVNDPTYPAGWPVAVMDITNTTFKACGQTSAENYYFNWVAFEQNCFN